MLRKDRGLFAGFPSVAHAPPPLDGRPRNQAGTASPAAASMIQVLGSGTVCSVTTVGPPIWPKNGPWSRLSSVKMSKKLSIRNIPPPMSVIVVWPVEFPRPGSSMISTEWPATVPVMSMLSI